MSKILLAAQGSQSIQFIRELFALGYRIEQISVVTITGTKNKAFITFLEYYRISFTFVDKENFNEITYEIMENEKFHVFISFSNPFILESKLLNNFDTIFINFHPGYLPNYRGSLSTVYSLINGENYVGGSWHYITKEIDRGNIINRFKINISPSDTAFSLNHKIFSKGISNLNIVLERIKNNYSGLKPSRKGKFYKNIFPNLDHIKNQEKRDKILYFPPHFTN